MISLERFVFCFQKVIIKWMRLFSISFFTICVAYVKFIKTLFLKRTKGSYYMRPYAKFYLLFLAKQHPLYVNFATSLT